MKVTISVNTIQYWDTIRTRIYKLGPNPIEYALTTTIMHTRMIQFVAAPWRLVDGVESSTTSRPGVTLLTGLWLWKVAPRSDWLVAPPWGKNVPLVLMSTASHGLLVSITERPLRSPMVIMHSAMAAQPLMSSGLLPARSENTMEVRVAATLTSPRPREASTAEESLWNPTEWKMVEE